MRGLTKAQREFLQALEPYRHPVSRKELGRLADRAEDRVRQSCKRFGYVEFVGGWLDGKHWPMGWRLTTAGRRALGALQ